MRHHCAVVSLCMSVCVCSGGNKWTYQWSVVMVVTSMNHLCHLTCISCLAADEMRWVSRCRLWSVCLSHPLIHSAPLLFTSSLSVSVPLPSSPPLHLLLLLMCCCCSQSLFITPNAPGGELVCDLLGWPGVLENSSTFPLDRLSLCLSVSVHIYQSIVY